MGRKGPHWGWVVDARLEVTNVWPSLESHPQEERERETERERINIHTGEIHSEKSVSCIHKRDPL